MSSQSTQCKQTIGSHTKRSKRVRVDDVTVEEQQWVVLSQPFNAPKGSVSQVVMDLQASKEVKIEALGQAKNKGGSYLAFQPRAKKTTVGYEQAEIKVNTFLREQSLTKQFKYPMLRKIPFKDLNGRGDCRLSVQTLMPEFCSFMLVCVRFQGKSETAKIGEKTIRPGTMLVHLSGFKAILVGGSSE